MVRVLSCGPTWYSEKEEAEWGLFFSVGKLLLNSRVRVLKCFYYSIKCILFYVYCKFYLLLEIYLINDMRCTVCLSYGIENTRPYNYSLMNYVSNGNVK